MSLDNVCRICLEEENTFEGMTPLFLNNNSECAELVRKIELCGGIVMQYTKGYPIGICERCLSLLHASYTFRQLCKESMSALKEHFNTTIQLMPESSFKTERAIEEADILFPLGSDVIVAEAYEIYNLIDSATSENAIKTEDGVSNQYGEEVQPCETVGEEPEDSGNIIMEVDEDYLELFGEEIGDILKAEDGAKYEENDGEAAAQTLQEKLKKTRKKSAGNLAGKFKKTHKIRVPKKLEHVEAKKCRSVPKEEQNNICEICGNTYPREAMLRRHMRRHLDVKPYQCELCTKTFAVASEIRRHMRIHTGEKPYSCSFCGRLFADRSSNLKHERTHTNTRPFVCQQCGKSFTYSNVLKDHMFTHTGERPYDCKPCGKTFSRKHQREQHFATMVHKTTVQRLLDNGVEVEDVVD